jgi:hypothetical protein
VNPSASRRRDWGRTAASWDFTSAAGDSPAERYALYDGAVDRPATDSTWRWPMAVSTRVNLSGRDGTQATLRRPLCDMLEEYGRYTGHLHLIREAVDGVTCEDPLAAGSPDAHCHTYAMDNVVQQQVEAFNAHDLEAFVACYSEDVVIATGDGVEVSRGAAELRRDYGPLFEEVRPHAEVRAWVQRNTWVVADEVATFGDEVRSLLVAYRVNNGVIDRVLMLH